MRDPVKHAVAKKRWREAHRDVYAASARKYQAQRRALINQLKAKPCADCGGEFPAVCMDYDHVRGIKLFTIGESTTRTLDALREEIAKCDVVCSNCHRIRTQERQQRYAERTNQCLNHAS